MTTTGYEVRVRPEKAEQLAKLREQLESSEGAVITEYRGLSDSDLKALRAKLREGGATYNVVKNTLALKAATELGIEGLEDLFTGPTAIAWVSDPVSGAKAVTDFASDHDKLVVKGAVVGGKFLDLERTKKLAKTDPLEVSLAKIAGGLTAPVASMVWTLQGPISQIIYVLQERAKGDN